MDLASFFEELAKIAASKGRLTVAQSRTGRRPMRVDTLLRKEKDGSLYKAAGLGTNSAGFALQGKVNFQGLPVAIENRKGSVREGKNDDGSTWRTKFKIPYGYIEGTKGADGEEVDAYVGDNIDATHAFIVNQKNDKGAFDEHTVMLGFNDKGSAKKSILDHYDNPKYVGSIKSVEMGKLKGMLKTKMSKLAGSVPLSVMPTYTDTRNPGPAAESLPPKQKKNSGDVPTAADDAVPVRVAFGNDNKGLSAPVRA